MKKIFFDARYIRPGFHDGISRFSANLFAAVSRHTEITAIISDEAQLEKLPKGTKWVKIGRVTSISEIFTSMRLNKYRPDVVFSPMQTIGSIGKRFKLILTVHDLIYFRHKTPPENFTPFMRVIWRLFHLTFIPERILLSRANGVVAVSKTTAEEIRQNRLYRKDPTIVYNAPERPFSMPKNRRPNGSLIYMGTFMGYKNVETLIRGVAKAKGLRLELLSPISSERRSELQGLANDVKAEVRFHNGVTDAEYRKLLDNATALVSASLDEGFGIPVVEAMERGVPVLLSDIGIFREVAGGAGRYFDSKSDEDFATQALALQKKPTPAADLRAQAAKFNWDDSAKRLLKLIETI